MYEFIPITDEKFPLKEIEELFNEYSKIFVKFNINSFSELAKIAKDFLYAIYVKSKLEGCLFITDWFNNCTECEIGGFAKRGNGFKTKQAIEMLIDFIFKNYPVNKIYSETYERAARISLLKAGFKKVKDNLLVIERNI